MTKNFNYKLKRNCIICNTEFTIVNPSSKYCSKQCWRKNRFKYMKTFRDNNPAYDVLYNRKRYETRRKRFFELYVFKKGCPDCGVKYKNRFVYEFDHTNGIKKADRKLKDIRKAYNYSLKKLFKEFRTGEYICANCHKIRTYTRKQHPKRIY